MKRFPGDPSLKLEQYRAARKRYKKGQEVNASDMAAIAGMTWANMRKKIIADKSFPVLKHGSEGKAYSFDPAMVLDYFIEKTQSAIAARKAREGIVRLGVEGRQEIQGEGGSLGESDDLVLRSTAIKKYADAAMAMERLKAQQGQYILAVDVAAILFDMMATLQAEILSVSARLDPAGRMDNDSRSYIDKELRRILTEVQGKMMQWLEKRDTGSNNRRAA